LFPSQIIISQYQSNIGLNCVDVASVAFNVFVLGFVYSYNLLSVMKYFLLLDSTTLIISVITLCCPALVYTPLEVNSTTSVAIVHPVPQNVIALGVAVPAEIENNVLTHLLSSIYAAFLLNSILEEFQNAPS
jgi:hypothetical protein